MQGQSSTCTPVKQSDFRAFLTMHMRMVGGILGKSDRNGKYLHPAYNYFDLNAGCGVNERAGELPLPGSPLIFAQVAQALRVQSEATMFEANAKAATSLDQRMAEYRAPLLRLDVARGDHLETAFPMLSDLSYGKPRYGMVYSDPNGADTPFGLLAAFAEKLPAVDILCSVNGTSRKRARMSPIHDSEKFPPIAECIAQVPKRYCLIRHPYSNHHWALLFFTNYAGFLKHPPHGWDSVDGDDGREWLEKLSYCDAERRSRGTSNPSRRASRPFQSSLPF
jgi:hypothetical protein